MSRIFDGRDIERAALMAMAHPDPKERPATMGQARAQVQDRRVVEMKAAATPPISVGPEIRVAPARGAFRVFTQMEVVRGSSLRAKPAGHAGRQTLAAVDVFDRMIERARAAHLKAGGEDWAFVPPLSPGQVEIGRTYKSMVEKHSAGGVRCSSLEAQAAGGMGGGFMDAQLELSRRIEVLRRRADNGRTRAAQCVRPSVSGSRVAIFALTLVDMVCLQDCELGQVLDAHGWKAKGPAREALRKALAAALDRMQGYDLARAQDVG